MSSNGEGGAAASATPSNEAATTLDGAPTATALNGSAKPAAAPRAKIAISLKKKSKPKKAGGPKAPGALVKASSLLAEEYGTIAEEAAVLSQRRKEEGTVLVIPCKQSQDVEEKRKRPLLAGRLALLRKGGEAGETGEADDGAGHTDGAGDNGAATGPATTDAKETTTVKDDNNTMEDDEAMQELIQSANQKDGDGNGTTHSGRGLVIAAPAQNSLTTQPRTNNDAHEGRALNDEEVFQQELSHHAADVAPTSNVYANVAIADFGSALLRGMGWMGGATDNKKDGPEEKIKQRPHRLGLGATPVPLPSAGSSKASSGGIHRRARRPDEVRRDEERQKQQEEAEKRAEEKKRLDVQVTLQNGSVVHVVDRGEGGNGGNERKKRALVVQTTGVPGLNRILVQMEGASEKTSVAKGSVALCSWEELEATPFAKRPLKDGGPKNGAREAKQKSESRRDSDRDNRDDRRRDGRERDRRDYSDDDSRRRSESRKRKKRDRRDRCRSRSESRERTNRRKDRSRRSRSRSGSRERQRRKKDSDRRRRDRSRSPDDRSKSKRSKHHHPQLQLHWLIPNIRVRLVSKKMPRYHLQKGIVQDVLAQTQQTSGPKAVLLMEDGQVLDKVPERYLETALPRTGGNVIILEGREKQHRWKKGRLLEKQSSEGCGVVQLEEDLEVVKVDLDGLAEWCGRGVDE